MGRLGLLLSKMRGFCAVDLTSMKTGGLIFARLEIGDDSGGDENE